ncbi:hypothetical protein [Saccharopolyspora gregorii]|uniref:hypothetical protein n=1 Tax=Saccharopolyspora gregorii TaxID=33914 RepID=UPI0031EA95F8
MPIGAGFAAASGGSSTRPEPGSAEWLRLVSLVFGAELPRRYLADLRPVLAEFKPDLVVHEAGNHGAGLAAREAGIPGVCHGFGRQSPANYAGFDPALRSVAADAGIELPEGDLRTLGNPFLDIFPLRCNRRNSSNRWRASRCVPSRSRRPAHCRRRRWRSGRGRWCT